MWCCRSSFPVASGPGSRVHKAEDRALIMWRCFELPRDDRQDQAGASIDGVEDGLMGDAQFRVGPVVAPGIVIAVKIRKVRARDVKSYALTALEQDASGIELDFVQVGIVWFDQGGVVEAVAISR